MMAAPPDVHVVGVGFSVPERPAKLPLEVHTRTAVGAALEDAGLTYADVDGLSTYPAAPFIGAGSIDGVHVVTTDYVARHFGFPNIQWCSENSWGLIAAAFGQAVAAIASGQCSTVVLWRSMHMPASGYGSVADPPPAVGPDQFRLPWRLHSPVQWHALAYQRYLAKYGYERTELAELALVSRDNASRNPYAFFRDLPLTYEDYTSARMISDPLSLFDCDLPVQGATAIVLSTSSRARDRPWSALVAATAVNVPKSIESLNYTLDDPLACGGEVARQLRRQSGLAPEDIRVAELYDGFAPSTVYWLEAAGFCQPGEGIDFIRSGKIGRDGVLPANTFGGSLSAGRMHGLTHIAEAALQVSGRAGPRQVAGADVACAYVGSPMLGAGGVILTSAR